jgi:hypothetical protein
VYQTLFRNPFFSKEKLQKEKELLLLPDLLREIKNT